MNSPTFSVAIGAYTAGDADHATVLVQSGGLAGVAAVADRERARLRRCCAEPRRRGNRLRGPIDPRREGDGRTTGANRPGARRVTGARSGAPHRGHPRRARRSHTVVRVRLCHRWRTVRRRGLADRRLWEPPASASPALLGVQREVLRRFGGENEILDCRWRRFVLEEQTRRPSELQARLNVDGSVSGLRVVEPVHPDLATAAEVIVRNWRREPARVRGVPVEVPIRMTVDFRR